MSCCAIYGSDYVDPLLKRVYNDLPSSGMTFQTLVSRISIDLHPSFHCSIPEKPTSQTPETAESLSRDRDKGWTEYSLPAISPDPSQRSRDFREARSLQHHATVNLDMLVLSPATDGTPVLHYLDLAALAPSISLSSSPSEVVFTLVGCELRVETVSELRKSTYGAGDMARERRGGGQPPNFRWDENGGGGWMHAAKLWQGSERRRGMGVERDARIPTGSEDFFIQS